jgi:hypothetical protein
MNNKKTLDYPLRGKDILKILNNKTNLIEYSTLYNINNLDDIFINGSCVILYRASPTNAHWCCVFLNKDGLNFFDPYGVILDNEINEITKINPLYSNKYYNGGEKKLLKLFMNSKYNYLNYNEYKMQEMKQNINSCGRHVCCRLLFKDLSLDEYIKTLYKYTKNNYLDDIVLKITNKLF